MTNAEQILHNAQLAADYSQPTSPGLPNIAFCGRMGAGKTTAAEYLVDRFGYTRVSFAAALRRAAGAIWDTESRDHLQKLGVAVREIDEDAWVNAAIKTMEYASLERGSAMPFVVDDLRFPNEFWRLKEEGFTIVRVVAEQDLRIPRLRSNGKLQNEAQLNHESETALDGFNADHLLYNQGTRDVMQNALVEILYQEMQRS